MQAEIEITSVVVEFAWKTIARSIKLGTPLRV